MDQLAERLKNMTPLQRAVFALKETQARLDALERKRTEPVAIVGMACRFPGGATDPASYWRMLCNGVDAISEVPPERWNAGDLYDPDPAAPGKMSTRWGGFLDRVDEFDNHFFAISDREAERIDPQQRILLELAWESLEDAGLPPAALRGAKVGVFVGISLSEYGMMVANDLSLTDAHAAAGTSLCLAANRVSFAFGFQGPSMAMDTACSSSLVAVHLACQHIRSGECEAALAGGVNLLLTPFGNVNLTKAGFCARRAGAGVRRRGLGLCPQRRRRSGGAQVALGRLEEQRSDLCRYPRQRGQPERGQQWRDRPQPRRAGASAARSLPAFPGVAGQSAIRREPGHRYQAGRCDRSHGAGRRAGRGAPVGQPLPARRGENQHRPHGDGGRNRQPDEGRLGAKHGQVPPNLHFQTPNPDIPFDKLPLRVPRALEAWPEAAQPRFAGVSAFGFGGSNSHVVLEEPPAAPSAAATGESCLRLLPLSARTENALRELAERYVGFLRNDPPAWSDVCYTAGRVGSITIAGWPCWLIHRGRLPASWRISCKAGPVLASSPAESRTVAA